jgi:putative PIN family toxin of toxin-antitoxin system
MIRIFSDTNIAVSAAIKPKGAEAQVLDAVADGKLLLCLSEAILAEYEEVLRRPKLRLDPERVRRVWELIRTGSLLVRPVETLTVSPDEPDNRFLECADAAKAHYLVTGNLRHFPRVWKTTTVVTARELILAIGL